MKPYMDTGETKINRQVVSELPVVGLRFAGRIVNNRTGETLKVLVILRKQKPGGPVIVSAVDPEAVME